MNRDQTHSNPTFPQEYTLAETKRLTPDAIRELVIKAADRGVGGAPYYSVRAQFPGVVLPLNPDAVRSDGRGPSIPSHIANVDPQNFRRYEMPRNRRMLAQNNQVDNYNLRGDGIVLYDRMGTPGVQQLNPTEPGKFSRYQVAGPGGPQQGGVQNNPIDVG